MNPLLSRGLMAAVFPLNPDRFREFRIPLFSTYHKQLSSSLAKTVKALLVLIALFICQTGWSQTTFTFGGLGSNDSGGTGFKTVADNPNIVTSNILLSDGTEAFINENTIGATTVFIIKADGLIAAAFDVNDLIIRSFINTTISTTSQIVFRDSGGSVIQTMGLNANKTLGTTGVSIGTFFDIDNTLLVAGVSEIEFTINTPFSATNNFTLVDFTLTNIIPPTPNTSPVLNVNGGSSLNQGDTDSILQSELEFTDNEQGPASLTYTLDNVSSNGTLRNLSTDLSAGDSFTQADINAGNITYEHNGSNTTADSFQFDLSDGDGGIINDVVFNFVITAVDNEPPVITVNDITVNNDAGVCGATIPSYGASATDNSGSASLTFDIAEGTVFIVGTTLVTATATDGSGNSAQATFNVTVNDNEAPVLSLTGASVINLNLGDTYSEQGATATDNCSATISIGGDVVNTASVGSFTVTYDAVDPSGNAATQLTRAVNVIDAINPVITVNDITVNNDAGACGATIPSYGASATDNSGSASLTFDIAEGTVFIVGTTLVTATATDGSGNSAQATFNVTVNDNEAPVLSLTGAAVINLNLGDTYSEQGATATDNCSATVSIGGDVVNTASVGSFTVTYNAVDPSGNAAAQLTRTVNVIDAINPVITVNDITVNNDAGSCGATIPSYGASATDNSGSASLTFDIAEGTVFIVGTTLVTATATDGSGNSAQATFNVTVNDNEAPVLSLTGASVINLNLGDTYSEQGATATDNCSATISIGGDVVNTASVGSFTVTYDAVDPSGNAATQLTRAVNVIDAINPVITVNDITVNNDAGACGATIPSYGASATDNSGSASLTFDIAEGTVFIVGTTLVTATATDGSGNSAQATFNVTVNDNEAPVLSLTGAAVINLNLGDTYSEQGATATDNCSATVSIGGDVVNTASVGSFTVTYNAVDPSGNAAAQLTRTVNVIDLTPINLSLVGTNITCADGMDGAIDAVVSGGSAPLTFDWSNGATSEDLEELSAGTYTLTVTDGTGQTVSESITLTAPDAISVDIWVAPKKPAGPSGEVHTIYKGFGAQSVWLKAFANGGNGRLRYRWSGNNIKFRWGQIALVAPKETTTYEVLVTDKKGCTTVKTITINVIDIRCFHNNRGKRKGRKHYGHKSWNGRKVHICHKGKTLCVNVRSVWSHLRHGDTLGECTNAHNVSMSVETVEEKSEIFEITESSLKLSNYPNPTSGYTVFTLSSNVSGPARLAILDTNGVQVASLFNGDLEANKEEEIGYEAGSLPSGIYIVRLVTAGMTKTIKLMVQK